MRKSSMILLILLIVSIILPMTVIATDNIASASVYVNNNLLASSVSSLSINGIVLSPANDLIKSLGGSINSNQTDYNYLTTKILLNESEITLKLDSNIAQVNGKFINMQSPMRIINNRIMIPTKFISQMLGAEVYANTQTGSLMVFQPLNNNIVYTVQSGDSLWKISQMFGTTITSIQTQNNLSSTSISIGQKLIVKKYSPTLPLIKGILTGSASLRCGPSSSTSLISYLQTGTTINILGKTDNWYKVSSSKGIGYVSIWVSSVVQDITDSSIPSKYFMSKIPIDTSKDTITYVSYTVSKGDNIWSIAYKYGIPDYELLSANSLTNSSMLSIGQILKIPVHNIATHIGLNNLETLDWFAQANYVFPINKIGKVTDISSGKSFMIKRTMGANHSDTETLTTQDTAIMKDIFGGNWSWTRKPFILEVDGRKIAVSIAGMPHAGVDGVPYNQNVDNRSDGYGYGPNFDTISGNGMDGHFDLYFFNCLRHKDNLIDPSHQLSVSIAAGLK